MSNISFQRGEILTASKLNELVQAVTGESSAAAAGDVALGGDIPVQTHQVKQREFSSYLPPRHPVYIDQASPHWPLADGQPGWFWRASPGSNLNRLPVQPAAGQTLYLNTSYNQIGVIMRQELSLSPGSNQPWQPFPCVEGYSSVALGTVRKDKFRAGALSETLKFFDAPVTDAQPIVLFSPPSSEVPWDEFYCNMPPGTYYTQYSMVGDTQTPTKLFPALRSDGGMIFHEGCFLCLGGLSARNIELIPRFVLREAPLTSNCLTASDEELWVPPRPREWHKVATAFLNGVELSLNLQWVKPWFAYVSLSTKNISNLATLHQTWKKSWGRPGCSLPPDPFSVQANAWRVVSKSGPSMQIIDAEMFPASCAWVMHEEMILQAEGTGCEVRDENCNLIAYQPVLFQAYVRLQLAPQTGCWCVWYDCCWTQTP